MKSFYKIIIVGIAVLSISNFIIAQDLALGKPYSISAAPNYPYTAPSTDKTSLTDGVYTNGYFWSKPTTVGWQRRQVSINIDLGSIEPIGSVTFNTVRRSDQNVEFPQNIFVFISNDDKNYSYLGDAANTVDNLPGPYTIKKFILDQINQQARYVSLIVIPKKNNLFCDEIEVLKGSNGKSLKLPFIDKDHLNIVVDSLKNVDFYRKNLQYTIKKLVDSEIFTGNKRDQILKILSELNNKKITSNDLKVLTKKVTEIHASILQSNYNSTFIIEKYSPWDTLNSIQTPKLNFKILNYDFSIPKNTNQYAAFVITNSAQTPKSFTFHINSSAAISIQLFNVPYVPSINGQLIPDPLVPVNSEIVVPSGISELFIFKIVAKVAGISETNITISSENKIKTIKLKVKVLDFYGFVKESGLNALNWAYLSSPLLKDREEEAAQDLNLHHINTIVVPPSIIPRPGGNPDFNELLNYLSYFKYAQNILLSTGYSNSINWSIKKDVEFMSPEWKSEFIEWHKQLLSVLKSAGFTSKIYFYPYDEVHGKDIGRFLKFSEWVKTEVPNFLIYATLSTREAIDSLISFVDIAQIQINPDLLRNIPPHHCEIWIYGGSSPARSISPYKFYRLLSWNAFAKDFTGIGFWNYADEGLDKKLNLISDPLINSSVSYSVIYDGPGKEIISSRRWEAFKLGIEDYSIIKLYANKYGYAKAKNIVDEVLSNPDNTFMANMAIDEMLKKL